MAGHKQVVVRFGRIGVSHQSTARSDRLKFIIATGDKFLGVDLMPRIPDQAVL